MRIVEIEIKEIAEGRPGAVIAFVEEERAGVGWTRQKAHTMESGMPDAKRRILLADGQRLVIVPHVTETAVVYDPKQMAARPVEVPPGLTDAEREEAVRQQLEKETLAQEEEDRRRHAAIEEAKRKLAQATNPAGLTTPQQTPQQTPQKAPSSPATVSGARSSKDVS